MTTGESLTERVRTALEAESPVREVAMFGGRAFMVNEKLVVSVGGDGNLLVRTDPARATTLLAVDGAHPAEMAGRSMGRSWIRVSTDAVADEEGLSFWLDLAMEYNGSLAARDRRRGRRPQSSGSSTAS